MSKSYIERLYCKACKKSFDESVINEIDEKDNIVDLLTDARLFTCKCSNCGYESYFKHDLKIVDNNIGAKILITNNILSAKSFVKECDENPSRYNRLVMNGIEYAIEKYMIFKCGLDDKLVEIYKDNMKIELRQNNVEFDEVYFNANSVDDYGFVLVNKGNGTSYILDKSKYDMLYNNFKEFDFINRTNDYIVNSEYIYNMKMNVLKQEPLHYELLYREKALCSVVMVDDKYYYYNANVLAINNSVSVNVGDEVKEGIYLGLEAVSEVKLGKKFKNLTDILKVYYKKSDFDNLRNDVINKVLSNLKSYQIASKLSNKELKKSCKDEIIKLDNNVVGINGLYSSDYITILSSNCDAFVYDNMEYAKFKMDYFKVIENSDKIVLLHLPYNEWQFFSGNIGEINISYNYSNSDLKKNSLYKDLSNKISFTNISSIVEIIEG